jgi:uncharacterized Ntn-hydrolase superfamily protein
MSMGNASVDFGVGRSDWMRTIMNEPRVTTFSIVGFDPATGDLGVAVASKFLAVGAVVPFARAGVGAVATQSWANTSYGPRGLDLLASGHTPQQAIDALTGADEGAPQRQVGIVDAHGHAATFTGTGCYAWAGGVAGPNFACQGNILVGEATVQAMARTFPQAQGSLARRLLAALAAGQGAGGDSRGQQSAALLIVREQGGYGGFNDRMIDLRVDDAMRPFDELARLLDNYELLFLKPRPEDLLPIDVAMATELQQALARSGDYQGPITGAYDEITFRALERYAGRENLEERLSHDRADARLDRKVLEYMRAHIK